MPPTQPPAPPETVAVSAIDRAARTINNMLDRDSRYPSLEGYIGRKWR
jgi:nuclear pore complex protein Nup155